jgi:hypothetical protein
MPATNAWFIKNEKDLAAAPPENYVPVATPRQFLYFMHLVDTVNFD